jgi:hypothetical protein
MPMRGAKRKCGVTFLRYGSTECAHTGTLPSLHSALCLSRLSLGDARAAHVVPYTTPTDRVALSKPQVLRLCLWVSWFASVSAHCQEIGACILEAAIDLLTRERLRDDRTARR